MFYPDRKLCEARKSKIVEDTHECIGELAEMGLLGIADAAKLMRCYDMGYQVPDEEQAKCFAEILQSKGIKWKVISD